MSATKREISSGKSDDMSVYSYRLKRVFEVDGRQGIATDGQYYYVSGSKTLYKYSMDAKLLLKNEKPFINLKKPVDHIGDIDVYNGEIFAGCETFVDGRGINIQIAIYDSKTLKYRRTIDFNSDFGQEEVSGITVDRDRKVMWMTNWVDGSHIINTT